MQTVIMTHRLCTVEVKVCRRRQRRMTCMYLVYMNKTCLTMHAQTLPTWFLRFKRCYANWWFSRIRGPNRDPQKWGSDAVFGSRRHRNRILRLWKPLEHCFCGSSWIWKKWRFWLCTGSEPGPPEIGFGWGFRDSPISESNSTLPKTPGARFWGL